MNISTNAMNDPHAAGPAASFSNITQPTLLYWSVRREIWENRAVYIAPIAAAVVFLIGYLLATSHLGATMFQVSDGDADSSHGNLFVRALNASASIIMGVTAIVGFFYCLDALYSERRDRSILFWKSLPVSDLTTVASKVAIPLLVLPAVAFVVTVVTQLIMLLLGSAVLAAHGESVTALWGASSIATIWVVQFYMMVVLSLWYAPLVGWLLLVSAWAQRLAILWAILLPLALCLVERIGFGTFHLGKLVGERIGGAIAAAFNSEEMSQALGDAATSTPPEWARNFHGIFGLTPDPLHFISSPALWLGLVVAVAMFAGAIRLRRSREAL